MVYEAQSKGLFKEEKMLTLDKPEELHVLLQKLKNKSTKYNWQEDNNQRRGIFIIEVPGANPQNLPNPPMQRINILVSWGALTLDQIRDDVISYSPVANDNANPNAWMENVNRSAQDDTSLYNSLVASLTSDGLNKMVRYREKYAVNGRESGILFLKMLLTAMSVDSVSASRVIKNKLLNAPAQLIAMKSDISAFHIWCNQQMTLLRAKKPGFAFDILPQLFLAYDRVEDVKFRDWATRTYNRQDEEVDFELDDEGAKLMQLAEAKYLQLVDQDEWGQPSEDTKKIIALQAKVAQLDKRGKASLKDIKTSKKKGGKPEGKKAASSKKTKGKAKSKGENKKIWSKQPTWPKPTADMMKRKMFGKTDENGKKWYYCCDQSGGSDEHNRWVLHLPSKCNLRKQVEAKQVSFGPVADEDYEVVNESDEGSQG